MMLLRVLLLVGLAGLSAARASDKIDAPAEGASAKVQQPHVIAELIPERTTIKAGEPFGVILHLHSDPGWHTYWINPGDAGIPTTIKWTLPPGFTAGPIQWPVPEKHAMGPLVTYGYGGDVYLLTTITPPATGDLPDHFDIKAKAEWLVCQEECIPGKAELAVTLDGGLLNFRLPTENTELFKEARARLPVENTRWTVDSTYGGVGLSDCLFIQFKNIKPAGSQGAKPNDLGHLRFFPEQTNVLSDLDRDNVVSQSTADGFVLQITLTQNGDKPKLLSGVLTSDKPIVGGSNAVQIGSFPTDAKDVPQPPSASLAPSLSAQPTVAGAGPAPVGANAPISASGGPDNSLSGSRSDSAATGGHPESSANTTAPAAGTAATQLPSAGQPLLLTILLFAFIGGLILNLMPCVLPVLSLKVFSLIKHAGDQPGKAWQQGAAFTAGVVISFWILAGALLALRAAGNQLGWGFQMQSPGFVAALIVLFFLIALNLFGVFEIGTSLVGLDAKTASRTGGLTSSFLNGALATLAATPCTAPFMGSALGFAAQQPAIVSMLIFTALALGMAAPYLLLTIFPQTLRFVPKPGAWMESLKQFMGFLLMGTVIFLSYVFTSLTYQENAPMLLFALLIVAVAAWVYGKWSSPIHPFGVRAIAMLLTVALLGGAIYFTVTLVYPKMRGLEDAREKDASSDYGWQNWTPDAVQTALAKGQPVFVDFTAAWCLSCKVNERVALETDSVKNAFTQKNVALFRADWTHSDPLISQTLQQYNRDGVPLYLLYSPKSPSAPQVLPEVLTPGIVLDALNKI